MSIFRGWSRSGAADKGAGFAAMAEKARRAGDSKQAVAICREGLEKFPEQLSARVTLGCALLDLDRFDEARGELEAVLRRAPDNLAAIRAMAELHDRSENAALLNLEPVGDWPPTEVDISEAAAAVGATAPSEPRDEDPVPDEIEAVLAESEELEASAEIVDSIEAAAPVEVLVDFDVPDDPAVSEGPNPPDGDQPADETAAVRAVDGEGDERPEANGQPDDPADAEAGLVDLGEPASEISPLDALEEFLRRAGSRRSQLSSDTTA